jgi:hypothetical protein
MKQRSTPELEGLTSWRAWGMALGLFVGLPLMAGVIESWTF